MSRERRGDQRIDPPLAGSRACGWRVRASARLRRRPSRTYATVSQPGSCRIVRSTASARWEASSDLPTGTFGSRTAVRTQAVALDTASRSRPHLCGGVGVSAASGLQGSHARDRDRTALRSASLAQDRRSPDACNWTARPQAPNPANGLGVDRRPDFRFQAKDGTASACAINCDEGGTDRSRVLESEASGEEVGSSGRTAQSLGVRGSSRGAGLIQTP
jgi:hypothetical protein